MTCSVLWFPSILHLLFYHCWLRQTAALSSHHQALFLRVNICFPPNKDYLQQLWVVIMWLSHYHAVVEITQSLIRFDKKGHCNWNALWLLIVVVENGRNPFLDKVKIFCGIKRAYMLTLDRRMLSVSPAVSGLSTEQGWLQFL